MGRQPVGAGRSPIRERQEMVRARVQLGRGCRVIGPDEPKQRTLERPKNRNAPPGNRRRQSAAAAPEHGRRKGRTRLRDAPEIPVGFRVPHADPLGHRIARAGERCVDASGFELLKHILT